MYVDDLVVVCEKIHKPTSMRGKTASILPILIPEGSLPHSFADSKVCLSSLSFIPSCLHIFSEDAGMKEEIKIVIIRRDSKEL